MITLVVISKKKKKRKEKEKKRKRERENGGGLRYYKGIRKEYEFNTDYSLIYKTHAVFKIC